LPRFSDKYFAFVEGRRKKEEGRRKKEEGRRKREEGRGKREEGRGKVSYLWVLCKSSVI